MLYTPYISFIFIVQCEYFWRYITGGGGGGGDGGGLTNEIIAQPRIGQVNKDLLLLAVLCSLQLRVVGRVLFLQVNEPSKRRGP